MAGALVQSATPAMAGTRRRAAKSAQPTFASGDGTVSRLIDQMARSLISELGDVVGQHHKLSALVHEQRGAIWDGKNFLKLARYAKMATGDEMFGFGPTRYPLGVSDLVLDIAVRCSTLRDALTLCGRLCAVMAGTPVTTLDEAEGWATIGVALPSGDSARNHFLHEWYALIWYKMAQWLIGSELNLDAVYFAHPIKGAYIDYTAMFGVDCVFSASRTTLKFAGYYLDRAVVRDAKDATDALDDVKGNLIEPASLQRNWKGIVSNAFRACLAREQPLRNIEQLAAEFGICSQTIRRKLKAEGTSYRQLKAEVRREMAINALQLPGATIREASLRAGFSEPNGLTRALRTSSGLNSTGYRELAGKALGLS